MPRHSSAARSVIIGPQPAATRLQPPDDLTGPERAVFIDAVLSCRPGHFQPADSFLLAAYSRAVILEKQASGELAASGPVLADGRVSPWIGVLAQASKSMLALSRQLRLSPLSRPSASPERQPGAVSYYERSTLEGSHDDAN